MLDDASLSYFNYFITSRMLHPLSRLDSNLSPLGHGGMALIGSTLQCHPSGLDLGPE
jgi:hypothetical protein